MALRRLFPRIVLLLASSTCLLLAQPDPRALGVLPADPVYDRLLSQDLLNVELVIENQGNTSATFDRGEARFFDENGAETGVAPIGRQVFREHVQIFNDGPLPESIGVIQIPPGRTALLLFPFSQFARKKSPARFLVLLYFLEKARPLEFEIRPRHFGRNAGDYIFPLQASLDPGEEILNVAGHELQTHHRRAPLLFDGDFSLSQRFAYDFQIVRGCCNSVDGRRNEDYYVFGHPVVAIGDGVVTATRDSISDNVPGRANAQSIEGNYVVIDHENGEFSSYVHLRRGSVRVVEGQRVRQGEQIGEAGNSGNSDGPHLHFELRRGLGRVGFLGQSTLLASEGVPVYFTNAFLGNVRQLRSSIPTGQRFSLRNASAGPGGPPHGPGRILEVEPNNDLAQAQPLALPVTVQGQTEAASIGGLGDAGDRIEDVFRLEFDREEVLFIGVDSQEGSDLDLLMTSDSLRVVAAATSPSVSERFSVRVEPGTYFLMVSAFGPGPRPASYELRVAALPNQLSFAHLAAGGGIESTLWVVNAGEEPLEGGFSPRSPTGLPVSPDQFVATDDPDPAFLAAPGGISRFSLTSGAEPISGSAQLWTRFPAPASLLFSGRFGAAGVEGMTPQRGFLTPVEIDFGAAVRTGIALSNPSGDPVEASLTLRSADGVEAEPGSVVVTVPGNGQTAVFVDELYDRIGRGRPFYGTLEIAAQDPVAGLSIRVSPGELATFPSAPLSQPGNDSTAERPTGTENRLQLPHLGAGPGLASAVWVLNPGHEAVSGTARFFDQRGNPLNVRVDGEVGSEAPFSIEPRGIWRRTLEAADETLVGWASIESEAPLEAVVLFSGTVGVAGVGAVEPSQRMLFPVDTQASDDVRVGVAVANPHSFPVTATFVLRNHDGQRVSSSEAMTLPPRGQLARFGEELFPVHSFESFLGTLEMTSSHPLAAVALRVTPGQLVSLAPAVTAPPIE